MVPQPLEAAVEDCSRAVRHLFASALATHGDLLYDWPGHCSVTLEDATMTTTAESKHRSLSRNRARSAARALIHLADLGTVPELAESCIASLRLLAHGSGAGPEEGALLSGLAELERAYAHSELGLDLAEQRLFCIGLSLLASTPQFAAALPASVAVAVAVAC